METGNSSNTTHYRGNVNYSAMESDSNEGCNGELGLGMALRDHEGTLLALRTRWLRGTLKIREGESYALIDAIRWVAKICYEAIQFEVDLEEVAVKGHANDDTEFG
ncbi:hypothetical protein LINPERHAP1_LOCUS25123, partial [Linum perenne]